jgi:hypothetical protein
LRHEALEEREAKRAGFKPAPCTTIAQSPLQTSPYRFTRLARQPETSPFAPVDSFNAPCRETSANQPIGQIKSATAESIRPIIWNLEFVI